MKLRILHLVALSCALVLFVSLALAAEEKAPNEEIHKEETIGINGHGGGWGGGGGGHGGGGWGGGGGHGGGGGGHGGGGWGGGGGHGPHGVGGRGGGGHCRYGCCGYQGSNCRCCYDAEEARAVQFRN